MPRKIPVRDLQIGMFVTELDRPWLESPFLFQGFLIETEEELAQLQSCCDHVYVEEEAETPGDGPGGLSLLRRRRPAARVVPVTTRDRIGAFRDSYRELHAVHRRIERGLIKLLGDGRIGHLINTTAVRQSVNEMLDIVLSHPDAAMWLTKLHSDDERTATHCLNVTIIALAFALHLGLPREDMEAIGLGALLHDIGLSVDANEVIRKEGRLTDAEFELVKAHPESTIRLLDKPDSLPRTSLEIIRWHHERLDGSGYPDGLAGDEIPRHALLVGLADAYDAMASERAWRKAMAPPDVLSELYRTAEGQFGKALVEQFIQGIGIYPAGSVVQLDTGAIGVVAGSDDNSRLEPLVLLVRDENGQRLHPYHLVDLQRTGQKVGKAWKILKVVDPEDYGINLAAIVADEMRAFSG